MNINLNHPMLRNAVAEFNGNLRLRLGGSLEDFVLFDTSDVVGKCGTNDFSMPTNATRIGFEHFSGCLTLDRWDEINSFCSDMNCDLLMGIGGLWGRDVPGPCPTNTNCRHTRPTPACCTNWKGAWDPSNARSFLEHVSSRPNKVYGLEFGNELVGSHGIESHISAAQYAADWKVFVSTIVSTFAAAGRSPPLTVAPDSSFDSTWFANFLQLVNEEPGYAPDIVAYHGYPMGSGGSSKCGSKMFDPKTLNRVRKTAAAAQAVVTQYSPSSQLWMGETGGCFGSGRALVTDSFHSGFWYLDSMGSMASRGHASFCRQTLVGGNYGLLNTTTFEPNPDYYSLLLWSRLMGSVVLNVTKDSGSSSKLRVYAHCRVAALSSPVDAFDDAAPIPSSITTANTGSSFMPGNHGAGGGVTFLLINLDHKESIQVHVAGMVASVKPDGVSGDDRSDTWYERHDYLLQSARIGGDVGSQLASQGALLNGEPLRVTADGAIPLLKPKIVTSGDVAPIEVITMPPISYGYFVYPSANLAACNSELIV